MSEYRIFQTQQFERDLQKNLGARREKIEAKLREYVYPRPRIQPYFGKNIRKLRGYNPETWRYRTGAHRFFYEIDEKRKIIFLLAAETRQGSY